MIKSAIIGTGHIARQHLNCLTRLPGVQVAAVCDLSPIMAQSTAHRYSVPRFFTNHRDMLEQIRPDIVHITTPPQSHFPLAMDALAAGAHVFVEKPLSFKPDEITTLLTTAQQRNLYVIEDYNYLFNTPVKTLLDLLANGERGGDAGEGRGEGAGGDVIHVEVLFCLDILGKGSRFADPNIPHPTLALPGGAIADFLTHLAYLAHAFIGPHQTVQTTWSKRTPNSPLPHDEFRALIVGSGTRSQPPIPSSEISNSKFQIPNSAFSVERSAFPHSPTPSIPQSLNLPFSPTALLAFSAHAQPDTFELRLYTTKLRAAANLFEHRLTIDKLRQIPRPLIPLANAREEARTIRKSAYRSLWKKLSGGPGAYEGLHALLTQTYANLQTKSAPVITPQQILEVNNLLIALANSAPSTSPVPASPATTVAGTKRDV